MIRGDFFIRPICAGKQQIASSRAATIRPARTCSLERSYCGGGRSKIEQEKMNRPWRVTLPRNRGLAYFWLMFMRPVGVVYRARRALQALR
jgi:hypothetical protein